MSLIRWRPQNALSPFADLLNLQQEVNRLFNGSSLGSTAWAPAVDVYDNKDSLVIKADLPGLTQKDIDVSIEDDILKIKGQKKQEQEVKEDNYYRLERAYGSFERSFSLPVSVDAAKIKAAYKDGVLQLTLPKKEQPKPKQIKVDIT